MEQLKNTIAEIFDEINWKYKLHHFEDRNIFELNLQVGDYTPTHLCIVAIHKEETFHGYEIVCTKAEKLPIKFIPNGILIANRFNMDCSHVNCEVDDDGSILFIKTRNIAKGINRDDLFLDINVTAEECDMNTAAMIEAAMASNEVDLTHTCSFELF